MRVSARFTVFPSSYRGAGLRFCELAGRPGPERDGRGTAVGRAVFTRMWRNPRQKRAGVSRRGSAGRSQGRRRSSASGRARRSWVWAAHRGGVVGRPQPDRVQNGRPRGAACFQGGHEGAGPARDHLIGVAAPSVDVAEQQFRTGGGVVSQPVAHIHREHDPPVGGPRQRRRGQEPAQATRFQPAVVDRVVHRPVPTPMLGRQRQLDQRRTGPSAQHRVRELEERVRTAVKTVVELDTKVGQDAQRGISGLFRGETLHQRPFFHATLLDTSKREERPPSGLQNGPRSTGRVTGEVEQKVKTATSTTGFEQGTPTAP